MDVGAWLERVSARLPDRERSRLLLLAVAVGSVGGASAVAFEVSMDLVGKLILGTEEPSLHGVPAVRGIVGAVLSALACGVAGILLTRSHKPKGIPDVIGAVRGEQVDLDPRDGALSTIAGLLAIGGGQSSGREGPIVMLGGTVAAWVCHRLKLQPRQTRVLVAAGAAAGIAASFNSPLGGAFFALEVLLGTFAVDAFAPTVVASVTGTVVGQSLLGERLALAFPVLKLGSPKELLVYPVLGVVCGLVALLLRSLLRRSGELYETVPMPAWLRPTLSGVLVGLLAMVGLHQVMGNGYALLEGIVGGVVVFGPAMLGLILVTKLIATAVAYGGKSGGGIFAPTLFLGAITGQLVGEVTAMVAPSLVPQPGVLAAVGMGAVAAAISHAPVTMALMIAEMTGNYAIVLPLLVTIALAVVVAAAADRYSLYVQVLVDRGLLVEPTTDANPVQNLRVADVMVSDGWARVAPTASFDDLASTFLHRREDEVVVVEEGRPLGLVDIQDIKQAMLDPTRRGDATARALCRPVPTVRTDTTSHEVMALFYETSLEVLPVVDADGKLIGMVSEHDLVGAVDKALESATPAPAERMVVPGR